MDQKKFNNFHTSTEVANPDEICDINPLNYTRFQYYYRFKQYEVKNGNAMKFNMLHHAGSIIPIPTLIRSMQCRNTVLTN